MKLQDDGNKTIIIMFDIIEAFETKLEILCSDIIKIFSKHEKILFQFRLN